MKTLALLTVAVLLAGCGGDATPRLSSDAADLVPPEAIAFISFDTDLNSQDWQRVTAVWGPIFLGIGELDFERDVRPAVGDQIDFAFLDADTIVWLMKPKDESKLPRLVRRAVGPDAEIQKIGGWSVVTDSANVSRRVRAADSGRSLADVEWFNDAKKALPGDALAVGYGYGEGTQQLSDEVAVAARIMGSPRWIAARINAEGDAVRVHVRGAAVDRPFAAFRPRLLREVPSGAILAASFKDFPALPRGEGILYVVPSAVIPTVFLMVETATPEAAERALERLGARIRDEPFDVLDMRVVTIGNRVVLANGPTPRTGGRLVDDRPFKEALAAADVPDTVTWLAYADIQRLMPFLRILWPDAPRLEGAGTLVAFGTRSGLEARITRR